MPFDERWLFRDCPWCGLRDAQMHVLSREIQTPRAGDNPRYWALMGCPRCAKVVVIEMSPIENRIIGIIPESTHETDVAHLPDDIREYYRDAIRVLDVGVPDAAAVQLRRTLEAAAAYHGIDSGPLVSRIRKLIKDGLITSKFGEALDYIREIGNVGAHAGEERLDEETVRRAMRFTTQALRNLFEIPAELDAIQAPQRIIEEAIQTDTTGQ